MPKEKRIKKIVYLDTNFCRDCIKKSRNDESIKALSNIKEKKFDCYTSAYTSMELTWIEKEEIYFYKKVRIGWDINQIIRGRYHQDLNSGDLKESEERISKFFNTNKFVKFTNMDEEGWNLALKVASESNLPTADIIQLVSAWKANCNYLITNDDFFIREGNKILKIENVGDKLKILTAEDFNKECKMHGVWTL